MINQIVNMLVTVFNSVSTWFALVFGVSGAVPLYLGAIVIFLCVRFLLAPLLGAAISSGASDKVKQWKKEYNGNNSNKGG